MDRITKTNKIGGIEFACNYLTVERESRKTKEGSGETRDIRSVPVRWSVYTSFVDCKLGYSGVKRMLFRDSFKQRMMAKGGRVAALRRLGNHLLYDLIY